MPTIIDIKTAYEERQRQLDVAASDYQERCREINTEFCGHVRKTTETVSITAAAEEIGVSRWLLHDLLNRHPA